MTEFNKPTPEDEAFDHIEQMNRVKKSFEEEMQRRAKTQQQFYDELRNNIIEEVALHVEKLKGFGKDTTDSLAVYIREMKK
jgi:endonuclease III-like uncharacterized protein